jgi:catalase
VEIQDKRIEYFIKADVDYGKQVKDGLAKTMESKKNTIHISTAVADEATDKARRMGHDADTY